MADYFSKDEKDRFVNPYNFIPLLEQCDRSVPELRTEDCYTGYFDCQMKLLTPLFIPNTSSPSRLVKESDKQTGEGDTDKFRGYDFFSYDDWSASDWKGNDLPEPPSNPVIPGSEIRGAVRSVYEAAFNGCLSSVSVDRVFSRRSGEVKNPGILKKSDGRWVIQQCERAMLFVEKSGIKNGGAHMGKRVLRSEYDKWDEGQELWIKLRKEPYTKTVGTRTNKIGFVVEHYQIMDGSSLSKYNKTLDGRRKTLKAQQYIQGWLHKGEDIINKHHESVFYISDKSSENKVEVQHLTDIHALSKNLEEYHDSGKNRMRKVKGNWYADFRVCEEGTLVYYSRIDDGHVYLSPACIGREVFGKTVGKLLELNGGYEPCGDKSLCSSCQVFGIVGKAGKDGGGTYASGSKVRISDAVLIHQEVNSQSLFETPIVLPELGEPKPGAVEFYTKSPYTPSEKPKQGQGYWTYDYKCTVAEGSRTNRTPLEYNQPVLRGRKFYWHSKVNLNKYKDSNKNNLSAMKQRIRPLKAGGWDGKPQFCFRVYFEHLSNQQLSQLKWSLDFGDPNCAHKMGRAKPLGFGSIQITVESLHLREINPESGRWEIKSPKQDEFLESVTKNKALSTVQIMADWINRPLNVMYPSVECNSKEGMKNSNNTASHQWFSANKGKPFNPNFIKLLPDAGEESNRNLKPEKALYKLIKKIKKV